MNDDDLMALLAELGVSEDKLSNLDSQMATADKLRNYRSPDGGPVNAGRYIVPNYGAAIEGAVTRYKGGKQYDQLQDQRTDVLNKQVAGRKAYGKAIQSPEQQIAGMGINEDSMTSHDIDEDELRRLLGY